MFFHLPPEERGEYEVLLILLLDQFFVFTSPVVLYCLVLDCNHLCLLILEYYLLQLS
uniref:Uncharacterized protein n=1 Tax=Rhizophora mucronata TaxID=61149 RepID=A0A2P2PPA6_RHIMU